MLAVPEPVDSGQLDRPGSRSPGQDYVCEHCGKTFPNSTRYHKHVKLHSSLKLFRCAHPGCGKSFKRKPHLTRHLAIHKEEKAYRCSHAGCNKTFTSNQRLTKHLRSHDKLCCELCGETFRKKEKFEKHQLAHEASAELSPENPRIRCPECNEEVDKKALRRHMKRHRMHSCDQCEEKFLRFQDLVKHKRLQHPNKTHMCPDCGKAYKREAALRDHTLRVHKNQVLLCPRPDCGQTFTSASNLYQHERVQHLGFRPFSCKQCGQSFAYQHVLRRHRQVVHTVIAMKNGSTSNTEPSSASDVQQDMSGLLSIHKPHVMDAVRKRAAKRRFVPRAFCRTACSCSEGACRHLGTAAPLADTLPQTPHAASLAAVNGDMLARANRTPPPMSPFKKRLRGTAIVSDEAGGNISDLAAPISSEGTVSLA